MLHTSDPCTLELAAKQPVLERRTKIMQSEFKADVARLSEDNNTKRNAEAAKRETRLIVATAGLLTFAVAVLGLLICWPRRMNCKRLSGLKDTHGSLYRPSTMSFGDSKG